MDLTDPPSRTVAPPRRLTWLAWLRLHRCGVLLAGLALFILLYPLTPSGGGARLAVNLGLMGLLLFVLWALDPERRIGILAWIAAAAIIALYAAFFAGSPLAGRAIPFAFVVLQVLTTLALLSHVLNERRVTADKILGAIATYLLLAMVFAGLFGLALLHEPQGLVVAADPAQPINWFRLFYFSVSVLTSSGLAELMPTSDVVRALVLLAQLAGTMYVAFLVARLANLFPRKG